MKPRFFSLLAGAFVLLPLLPSSASAQDLDSLRTHYMLELPPTIHVMSTVGRTSPGGSSGSPFGYGANWGDGFVGVSYQQRTRFTDVDDGAIVAGIGLGNSRDLVGAEVAITSFSTLRSSLGEVVSLSFKVHRAFIGNFGLAVGWESAVHLGENEGDGGSSVYVAGSKVWPQSWWQPFSTITATLGLGNGRFRFEDDVLADDKTVNVFGSAAVQIWEPAAFIADWSGQDLSLAVSLAPFRAVPLVITPAITDITRNAGDGARFIVTAGMGFDFAKVGRIFP